METATVILEKTDNGGYSAYIPELPGCIATAASLKTVMDEIRNSVKFHLDGMVLEDLYIPKKFRGNFRLIYKTDVASLFDWFSGILTKSGVSKLTGMNPSLISQYASGIKSPSQKQARKIEQALHNLGHELLEVHL